MAKKLRIRGKKAFVVVLLVSIAFANLSIQVKNTESIDPFFTLIAKGFSPTQMDILFLIKQQLAHIAINLDVIKVDMPDGDTTKIRDYDLTIIEFNNSTIVDNQIYEIDDPFFADFYSENGTINVSGYETSLDWDEELGTGRNEWYIQTGLQMTLNDSQERINLCWEWQHYMMEKILPCLPLFTQKDDNSTLQLLVFNLREVRPILGSRNPSPGNPEFTNGLAVRKAISYAINREEIRRVVLGDEYLIRNHPINPVMDDWLNPNSIRYCHDTYVARRYIDIAGFALCNMIWGDDEDPFPNFTDWEAVCDRNNPVDPTIDVTGFTFVIACLGLSTIVTISIIFYSKRRNKKKKVKN